MHLRNYEGGWNMQLRATRQYQPRNVGTEEEIVTNLEARDNNNDNNDIENVLR